MVPPIGMVFVDGQVRSIIVPVLIVKVGCISLRQLSNGLVSQNRTSIGRVLMRSTNTTHCCYLRFCYCQLFD